MNNEKNTENIVENSMNATDNKKTSQKNMTITQRKIWNAVFIIIFLLIFAGVNVLSVFLVKKFPALELDLTAKGAYSLQNTTKEYLDKMDQEVSVKVLMSEENLLSIDPTYGYQVNQLLREMSRYDYINLEYMDLTATSMKGMTDKYPDVDWTSSDNLLLIENEATGKYKCKSIYDVFSPTQDSSGNVVFVGQYVEQAVLSSIQKVTSDKIVSIKLSTGNGEVFNEESALYGYCSYMPTLLDDNAYEVDTINLLTQAPEDDTDVIIMMAPKYDLSDSAVDALSDWLLNDGNYGKTFFYIPYDRAEDTPNLDLFLEQWGMALTQGYINENDITKTVSASISEPSELYGMVDYVVGEYTDGLPDMTRSVIMPYCMPVEILDDTVATSLLTSSTEASVRMLSTDETVLSEEFVDSTGEALNAAAVATKTGDEDKSSKVVVWGSYDGLNNDWLYRNGASYNNTTYFINLLNILTDNQEESIVVEGVTVGGDYMVVTSAKQVIVFVLFVVLIPVAIFALGIVIWIRRRNR